MRRPAPLPRSSLGSSANGVNCSDFFAWPPNIFNADCYGITAAKLFGNADQRAAAYAATSPDVVYSPVAPPPAVGAPTGAALTLPPADGLDAANTIDRVLAAQSAAWKAEAQDTLNATAASITAAGNSTAAAKSTTDALLLIAAAFGLLLLLERK